jgi:hypothetical protein
MNLEDRLTEALHSDLDNRWPSGQLGDRIVEALGAPPRSNVKLPKVRSLARPQLAVGIVAACLVLALVPMVLSWRPVSAPGPVGGATPSGLILFDREGLAFDYPASWRTSVSSMPGSASGFPYFLGTGSGSSSCQSLGPSVRMNEETCHEDLEIGAGQVVVELVRSESSPQYPWSSPIDPSDPSQLKAGETFVTVGGLPAILRDYASVSGSDGRISATWTLSVPQEPVSRYLVVATMEGPGLQQMKAQVQALVASIRFDPAVPVLDPADGPKMAAKGLEQIRREYNENGCFSEPGATATATLTSWGYYTLAKPLPVTCSMAIEPSQIGSWKMTLTWAWSAGADRSAGTHTQTIWLDANGLVSTESGATGQTQIPYLP